MVKASEKELVTMVNILYRQKIYKDINLVNQLNFFYQLFISYRTRDFSLQRSIELLELIN